MKNNVDGREWIQFDGATQFVSTLSTCMSDLISHFFRPARFCIAQTSLLLGNYSEAERHLQVSQELFLHSTMPSYCT